MEEIVRAILKSRTVSLESVSDEYDIYGFKCLGIAEKLLDIDDVNGSSVYIWHVKNDILSVSKNEIERWAIDAPGTRHWILSERKIPETILQSLPKDFQVIFWGPEKLSRWVGESVLRGELVVKSSDIKELPILDNKTEYIENYGDKEVLTLKPLISLDDWLKTEPSGSFNSIPVYILVKIWRINGFVVGPESIEENKKWVLVEDPWMEKLYHFRNEDLLLNPPELQKIIPSDSNWLSIKSLKERLKPILDYRKKENLSTATDLVKSTMLEWWRVDIQSLELEFEYAQIPAWMINFEDGEQKILHSQSGKIYQK
tara:strand:+ start:608 stop:1549 length:942 start_codon:yes stop_codon:yes gene_type:complete